MDWLTGRDRALVRALVAKGIFTTERMSSVLDEIGRSGGATQLPRPSLADELVRRGLLDRKRASELENRCDFYLLRDRETRLLHHALKTGYMTHEQLHAARREQERVFDQTGRIEGIVSVLSRVLDPHKMALHRAGFLATSKSGRRSADTRPAAAEVAPSAVAGAPPGWGQGAEPIPATAPAGPTANATGPAPGVRSRRRFATGERPVGLSGSPRRKSSALRKVQRGGPPRGAWIALLVLAAAVLLLVILLVVLMGAGS